MIAVLVSVHRIIFAKRMAFPVYWHQDAPQVGMVAKAYAEHIEYFTLIPIGRAPHASHRIDFALRFENPAFQADPLVPIERVQIVYDLKARFGGSPIDRRDGAQPDEALLAFEETAHLDDKGWRKE